MLNKTNLIKEKWHSVVKYLILDDKKQQMIKEKLVSSSKIFDELRPKYFKRKFKRFLESITPEEIEALIAIKNVKINIIIEFF